MINILYITPNFTIGGTEGQIFNIAANLDKSIFRPYIISIGVDYGQRSQYAKYGIETGIFGITDFPKMVLFVKRHKINIVHSFYYGNFSGWDLVTSKLSGVRIFISSRRNMGYWRKTRHLVFDMFRNSFTDIIIANSYAVREKTISDERLLPSRVVVIYNGIDFLQYGGIINPEEKASFKRESGLGHAKKVIGMVSNIKNVKGYEYFLSAASIIRRNTNNVHFIIAGEGSDHNDFRRVVEGYGLNDCVSLLGLCQDVKKVFSMIDIFMYSSLSEGFPNIILEAMASGKVIVATDVGGTSEMLQNGLSGILVRPRDAAVLADATMKILDDEDLGRRMSEAAMKSARQFFSIAECVDQYGAIYKHLYRKKYGRG